MSSAEATPNVPSGGSGDHQESMMVISRREAVTTNIIRLVIIGAALLFALFPIVFVFSSAFNPAGTLSTRSIIPRNVDSLADLTTNFRALTIEELDIFPFWNWIFNSFVVATVSTVLVLLITALSAYAFSRFRFTGRRSLLLGVLLIQVFPNLLSMVALFLILLEIGRLSETIPMAMPFLDFIDWSFLELFGLNSLGGLILVYMSGAMGINTWLMKGFFDTIPREIDESARVDGATNWQIFWTLIFPLVRPILAVVGLLAFIGTFNEFVLARVLLRDKTQWTLMVGLYNFINDEFTRNWGKFAAGAILAGTPIVILYVLLQDQIVGGLTQGAVKG